MQNSILVVNEEPYCIWEIDIAERNSEFLDGIDVKYFDYLLNAYLDSEDEKRAAIALRATLHHAMETMFSLLGAYIQAPDCAYAWIAKCSNNNLRQLVKNIGSYPNTLFTKLNIEQVSWESISKKVFQCYKPDSDKNAQTAKLFALLWQRLSHELSDANHVNEYNSIKHGFRVRSGGFSLAVGLEHEYGVAPPAEEMKMIGSSEHGSSFFRIEPVGTSKRNRSIRSKRTSINWKVEKVILLIQLVSMSINNIVSALKIANGKTAETCKFLRPEEDDFFDKPWSYGTGVISCNIDFVISEDDVFSTTRKELLERLNEHKKS